VRCTVSWSTPPASVSVRGPRQSAARRSRSRVKLYGRFWRPTALTNRSVDTVGQTRLGVRLSRSLRVALADRRSCSVSVAETRTLASSVSARAFSACVGSAGTASAGFSVAASSGSSCVMRPTPSSALARTFGVSW
jgi:hypothetical protein